MPKSGTTCVMDKAPNYLLATTGFAGNIELVERWRLWKNVKDPFRFWSNHLSGRQTVLLSADGGETFEPQIFKSPSALRNYLARKN